MPHSTAPTIFITGSSSGIGKATALYFAERGWQVIATMRTPQQAPPEFAQHASITVLPLDVTQPAAITKCVAAAIKQFGHIDVVVNNAGYGVLGAFEASTPEDVEKQFAVNVFGLMNVTRAFLLQLRKQKSGTVVMISSIGGRTTFPLYSLYHATKWAVDGFSESLHYELEPLGIKVKIIEPGPIKTEFQGRSEVLLKKAGLTAYDAFTKKFLAAYRRADATAAPAEEVAACIYRAVTGNTSQLRYPVGGLAGPLLLLRKLLPERWFFWVVGKMT